MELHQTEVLQRSIRIAARPETVFSFFTDPKKMTLWKGVSATLDPRPGGIYRVDINGRDIARGEYVEVVPFSRVVFTWGWEGEGSMVPPGSTTVEVTLAPDGDGTLVTLKHFGLSEEHRAVHDQGWSLFLPRLGAAVEGRDPGPMPMSAGHAH